MTYDAKSIGRATHAAGQRRKELDRLFRDVIPLAERCRTDAEKAQLLDACIARAREIIGGEK